MGNKVSNQKTRNSLEQAARSGVLSSSALRAQWELLTYAKEKKSISKQQALEILVNIAQILELDDIGAPELEPIVNACSNDST